MERAIFLRVLETVAAAVIGGMLLRFLERRPRLIVYYGQIGAFRLEPKEDGEVLRVHTHAVVVRNSGRLVANNVRLPHSIKFSEHSVNVSVYPNRPYQRTVLPTGGEELLFPTLPPAQEVMVSYLYYPPLLWNHINERPYSDEGAARILDVLPTPQIPKWQQFVLRALAFLGIVTVIYALYSFGRLLGASVGWW